MAELRFEEGDDLLPSRAREPRGLAGLVIRIGLADNERVAEYLLVVIAVLCFAATIWLVLPSEKAVTNGPTLRDLGQSATR